MNPNEYSVKEILIIIMVAVIFLLVGNLFVIIRGDKINILYSISELLIGLTLARTHLKRMQREPIKCSIYLKNKSIYIYTTMYLLLLCYIDWNLFLSDYSSFGFKLILGGFLFYNGFKDIQTRKSWFYGGSITNNQALISGIIVILISLLILFALPLSSFFGGVN